MKDINKNSQGEQGGPEVCGIKGVKEVTVQKRLLCVQLKGKSRIIVRTESFVTLPVALSQVVMMPED